VFTLFRDPAAGFESYRDPSLAAAAAGVLEAVAPDVVHVGHLSGLPAGLVFEARARGAAVAVTLHDFWPVCALGQLLDRKLRVCGGPTPRRCLGCVGEQVLAPAGLAARARRVPGAAMAGRALARLSGAGQARVAERLETMREVLRSADALAAPSRFLAERMAALGFPGISVVPNGRAPLPVVARRPEPSGGLRFGFVGAAIPSKGVHVLAEAFRILDDPRALLRVHGAFAPYHGDVGYEGRVRAVLGAAAGEALRGPFPYERLADVLAGLDVLVVPSLWEENAPLTVPEAFQARLPVIVSDHGGLAEQVRDGVGGLRFRPGDARDLARVMRRMLDEPGLRERLAANPPPVPGLADHVQAVEELYDTARRRYRQRAGRVGVVVLDQGRPDETAAAVRSALDPALAPRVLVVENGCAEPPALPAQVEVLRLERNLGYAGGMNAGLRRLQAAGCDRVLLLNNDAVLEPGALRRLADALDDPALAAVGPTVLRQADGVVESRGLDLRAWGWNRLAAHGAKAWPREGRLAARALSGAAWMVRTAAFDRVGGLDDAYFFSFEETDWCLRAQAAGLGVAVVLGARVRHAGSRTLGRNAPALLYYAARNHLRLLERHFPRAAPGRWVRRAWVVGLHLAHALKHREIPRASGARAVLRGVGDFLRGRFGAAAGRP
jgi:GT2 family glycosyltransferase